MKFIKRVANSEGVINPITGSNVDINTDRLSVSGDIDIHSNINISGKINLPNGYIETVSVSGTNATIKRFDSSVDLTAKIVISGTGVDVHQAMEMLVIIRGGDPISTEYGIIDPDGVLFATSLIINGEFIDLSVTGHDLNYVALVQVLEN